MIATSYAVATLAVAFCLAAVPTEATQWQSDLLARQQLKRKQSQLKKRKFMRSSTRKSKQLFDIGSSGALTMVRAADTRTKKQGVNFQLKTAAGQKHLKIPNSVLLTGPFESLAEALQHRGKLDTSPTSLGITPDMQVRYFNNPACRTYLEQHFPEFVAPFDAETHGSYRGDICRSAVLAREGGFYVDLDMELRTPLQKLVDDNTTFMTARSAYDGALNALIATVPHNPVMIDTLAHLQRWYRNETSHKGLLGPVTMQRALEDTMKVHCPQHHWANVSSQFQCGRTQSVRLFSEEFLGDRFDRSESFVDCSGWGPTICPENRAKSSLHGAKFGLFDGPKYEMETFKSPSSQDIATREEMLIGWPRFEDCATLGCGLSGGVTT